MESFKSHKKIIDYFPNPLLILLYLLQERLCLPYSVNPTRTRLYLLIYSINSINKHLWELKANIE
jgi:hypothetical protein